MKEFIVSAFALLALVQLMVEPGQAISCFQVNGYLAPCVPYLTIGGEPSGLCCIGVRNLVRQVTTTADRREACNCVKEAASRFLELKNDAAQALPGKCGVKMDIPISKNVNCDIVS